MKGNENIKHPIGIDPQEITGAAAPGTTVEGPAVDCQGLRGGPGDPATRGRLRRRDPELQGAGIRHRC